MTSVRSSILPIADPATVSWEDLTPEELAIVRDSLTQAMVAESFADRASKGFILDSRGLPGTHRLDERGESIDLMLSAVKTIARELTEREAVLTAAVEKANLAALERARAAEKVASVPEPEPEPEPAPKLALSISDNETTLLGVNAQIIEEAAKEALEREAKESHKDKESGGPGWLSRFFERFRRGSSPPEDPRPSDEEERPGQAAPGRPRRSFGSAPSRAPTFDGPKQDALGGATRFPSQRFAQTGTPEIEDMEEDPASGARTALQRGEASIGRLGDKGQMLSSDRRFLSSLGVTDIYVVAGRSGELMRLDTFLRLLEERSPSPDNPTFDDLFPVRAVPEVSRVAETRYGVPYPGVAQCRFKLNGAATVSLPLSPKHRIMALSFADASGTLMHGDGPTAIREGLFGSCLVRPPPGAAQIIYQVAEKESGRADRRLIEKLTRVLPSFPSYLAEEDRAFRQALDMIPPRAADNAAIWYRHEIDKGYLYTMNKLAIQYQEGVGQGFDEAISGMRMGICDSFAYHLARGCVALSVPAFSIVGALPKDDAKTFQFNPGHAQTLVYAEDGIRVFDLTAHTVEERVNSWRVGRSEKRELFGRLQSSDATNRTVYESGEALGALLRGEAPPGEEGAKPRSVGFWGRRFEELGLRESTIDDFSLSHDQTSKLSVVETVAHHLLFTKRCDEAKESGTLRRAREFVEERPLPRPSRGAVRDYLPEQYRFVADYDPLKRLAELSKEAALDPAASPGERTEAVRWIIESMDPSRGVRGELLGSSPSRNARELHAMSLEQSLAFLCPETVSFMSIGEAAESFVSLQAVLSEWLDDAPRLVPSDISLAERAVEALEACSRRMAEEGFSMSYEAKLECGARAMRIAGELVERAGDAAWHLSHCETIASIYSNLDRVAGSPAARTLWDLGLIADDRVTRGMDIVLSSPERLHFFSSRESLESAASLLSSSIAKYFTTAIAPFADHSTRLERLQRAGFPIDLSASRPALQTALLSKVADYLSSSSDPVPNLPSPETPASTIFLEHTSVEAAALHRTLRAVSRLKGATDRDIVEAWPIRPEKDVGAALLASLEPASGMTLRQKIIGASSPVIGELDPLTSARACRDLTVERHPYAGCAIGYLERLGHYASERGKLLDGVSAICPLEWERWIGKISEDNAGAAKLVTADIAKKIFEGRSSAATYHAMLSQAVDFRGPRADVLSRLRAALESFDPSLTSGEEIMRESGWPENVLARHLEVPDDDRLAGILLRAALATETGPELYEGAVSAAIGLPPRLLAKLIGGSGSADGRLYAEMWRSVSTLPGVSRSALRAAEEVWEAALAKAHRALESDGRLKSAPYARYMFHETGRVLPITSGCEMDELRDYTPGDDIRMIAWAASARADKLVVKKTRAEEVRPVKLVVDLEWLASDLGSLEERGGAPKLERIFNQIVMAHEQGVRLDVALVNRACFEEIRGVTAFDDGSASYAGSRDFLRKVLSGMAGARFLASHEAEIYGTGQRPRYNILLGDDIRFERDTVAVFALSERNARRTEPALQHLRKQGVYVAAVRR